jgi:hypothetical protein
MQLAVLQGGLAVAPGACDEVQRPTQAGSQVAGDLALVGIAVRRLQRGEA